MNIDNLSITEKEDHVSKPNIENLVTKAPPELNILSQEIIKQYTPAEITPIFNDGWGNRYHKNFEQAAALYRIAAIADNCEA
ncbi:hypothetical protein [Candidatus Odyssella thessalonicensis]|uniref:hypothetical protein n=1 Tax=Candidatus Odyssella thessalonicensis TaxID=84647 RepID=UPI000225C057|nr:hypothetical protein [Candidatus Odyssella thessalonicensis]